jgi:PhnB protein
MKLIESFKEVRMARVSTYLNFSRNTEEAFNFYKSVFGGEFGGAGIMRLGDIPPTEGAPKIADTDKKLIMHIELPITGGHILMGTDAPESMGFVLNKGNNVHINIEPDSRAETKRLFDRLSNGGRITMELQDTFWGAYYGSCTDRFGIQWMVNCTEKKATDMRKGDGYGRGRKNQYYCGNDNQGSRYQGVGALDIACAHYALELCIG